MLAASSVARALTYYREYDARQSLPISGGLEDQSIWFLRFCEIVDAERGRWERKRQDMIEKQRQQE